MHSPKVHHGLAAAIGLGLLAAPAVAQAPRPPETAPHRSPEPHRDFGDHIEWEERETQRLINGLLADGALGTPTGTEYVSIENINRPIILILEMNTSPQETQREAEEIAKLTKRPVIPLALHATSDQIEEFVEKISEKLRDFAGIDEDASSMEFARALNSIFATLVGSSHDAAIAIHDRFTPAELAFLKGVHTLAKEIERRVIADEPITILCHSLGTVVCNKGFELAISQLSRDVERGLLAERELYDHLKRSEVYACGGFVSKEEWVTPGKLVLLNSKDDPISSAAGHNNWFQREGQDLTFTSHRFSTSYRQRAVRALEDEGK